MRYNSFRFYDGTVREARDHATRKCGYNPKYSLESVRDVLQLVHARWHRLHKKTTLREVTNWVLFQRVKNVGEDEIAWWHSCVGKAFSILSHGSDKSKRHSKKPPAPEPKPVIMRQLDLLL